VRFPCCLALCLVFMVGCDQNAAPVTLDAASATTPQAQAMPVGWTIEPTPAPRPTPTPGPPPPLSALSPDAQTAVAIATATGARPYKDSTGAWATESPGSGPPTVAPLRPPPTPIPLPPVQCQFDGRTFSVAAPQVPPVSHAATPGLVTLASGEVLPGVAVELSLSATSFVAGAVIRPEIRVHNATTAPVTISSRLSVNGGGAEFTGEPRSFPVFFPHPRPYAPPPAVPAGETWSLPSLVQLPFSPQRDARSEAQADVSAGGQFVRVQADVPLQLTAPTAAEELQLDVRVDHQQWCLRATDAHGGTPRGRLFMALQARGSLDQTYLDPRPDQAESPQAIWAGPWLMSDSRWQTESVAFSAWVSGEQYVTAHIDAGIPPQP